MKKIALILFALLTTAGSYAQVVTGIVKDAKTHEPLPFVNVGIVGKSIGTVTDDAGNFKARLTGDGADILKVSMVGYQSRAYSVADVAKANGALSVELIPDVINLKEVKVTNRKWKTGILGNTTKSQGTNAGFKNNVLGYEIGGIIKTKRTPTFLKRFNASISQNTLSDSVRLRLNIYSVKDGLPDQNLLSQNILTTVKNGQQSVSIDLNPYNIMIDDDKFFVSLEWIQSSRGHGLMFSASLLGSGIISRGTSQDKWEKVGLFSVGFNVLAEY
jgi:hypothetical protein